MEIRPCSPLDLEQLRQAWPASGDVAASHYREQDIGSATFLIAWEQAAPLGWALIRWGGCVGDNARAAFPSAVEVLHLHVRSQFRNRGVGSSVLGHAEAVVTERGIEAIAVSVASANRDAARLYLRLGYRPTGVSDVSSYVWRDSDGAAHEESETNELLVRRLLV